MLPYAAICTKGRCLKVDTRDTQLNKQTSSATERARRGPSEDDLKQDKPQGFIHFHLVFSRYFIPQTNIAEAESDF